MGFMHDRITLMRGRKITHARYDNIGNIHLKYFLKVLYKQYTNYMYSEVAVSRSFTIQPI